MTCYIFYFQAIFGGRLSSRRKNEPKANPVYKDKQNGLKRGAGSEDDMGGIEITVYNNIPTDENNHKNDKMKEQLMKENSRDKVTVTNGDVCVGDIIIENGYRNPAFDSDADHSDVQEHTLNYSGEGEGKDNMSGSDWPNIDDIALPAEVPNQDEAYEVIDYNRNSTKVKSVDPSDIEADISENSSCNDHVTQDIANEVLEKVHDKQEVEVAQSVGDRICDNLKSDTEVELRTNNDEDLTSDVIKDVESSSVSNSDLKINSADSEKPENESSENEQEDQNISHPNTNGTKLNGSVRSNLSPELELSSGSSNEKEKSKKKNKKIKQRKNSLPDHVLNSLNMKPTKPILVPVVVDDGANSSDRNRSGDTSNEQKSVKFSDDTVFNEHKPNKYKQERVTLKDLYKGKISSKEAVAKLNPMFVDEENQGIQDADSENKVNTSIIIIITQKSVSQKVVM